MPLPKPIAAGVCAIVLGAQLWVSFPISRHTRGWYWPFLPYPMYSAAHSANDSLVVPQLRAAACGRYDQSTILTDKDLGVPLDQLNQSLLLVARAPAEEQGRSASARLSRAIEAQHPGRFCSASAWLRVVRVSEVTTHRVDVPMRLAARWSMMEQVPK